MGPLSDTETYIKARESGDFDKFEQIMNDPRSGTAAQREMVARKVAAHKIGQDAVNHQPKDEAEQKAVMKAAREKMSTFVDMSDEDADNDLAVYEKAAKITLRDEVKKPVEVPSWSLPVQKLEDGDRLDFYNRQASTRGTKEWHDHHDGQGNPRNAKTGKLEKEGAFRPIEDGTPKPKKSEYDERLGYTVDKSYGEDGIGYTPPEASPEPAAEASPPPPSDPGPITLANPNEA